MSFQEVFIASYVYTRCCELYYACTWAPQPVYLQHLDQRHMSYNSTAWSFQGLFSWSNAYLKGSPYALSVYINVKWNSITRCRALIILAINKTQSLNHIKTRFVTRVATTCQLNPDAIRNLSMSYSTLSERKKKKKKEVKGGPKPCLIQGCYHTHTHTTCCISQQPSQNAMLCRWCNNPRK